MHWITPPRRQLVDRTMADLIITASPTTSSDTVPLPLEHQQASPANPSVRRRPALWALAACLLVRSMFGSLPAAWASAIVYVVHPAHTEAVVSIVGRSELLAASLFFSAWLAFRSGRTWLAAAAYFLSLLAKENAITLPAVIA